MSGKNFIKCTPHGRICRFLLFYFCFVFYQSERIPVLGNPNRRRGNANIGPDQLAGQLTAPEVPPGLEIMDNQRHSCNGSSVKESNKNDIWSQGKLICRETQGGWDDQPGGQKTERGRTIQIWKILT